MSIVDTYRAEFQVTIYDEDLVRSEKLADQLKQSGYSANCFTSRGLFLESLSCELPHIFILYYQPLSMKFREVLTKIREQSQEVEIIILGADQFWPGVNSLLKSGLVDDFWSWPVAGKDHFSLRLDRVIEKHIYRFMAEQRSVETKKIVENLEKLNEKPEFSNFVPQNLDVFDLVVGHEKTELGTAEILIEQLKRLCSKSEFVFLKNYPARNQMLIAKTSFTTEQYFRGQALNFSMEQYKVDKGEALNQLRNQLEESFDCEDFIIQPVELADSFFGFVVAINFEDNAFLKKTCRYLSIALRNLKLESGQLKPDVDTQLDLEVTSSQFPLALSREISRARRLKLPVSLIITHLEHVNSEDRERQAAMDLIRNNMRSYDFLSLLDFDKIAIVMPHCRYEDAAIKAETIRRQLVARGLKTQNTPLRLCFGVSEFPSLSQDSTSLIVDAEKACAQVLVSGKNKVCLYTATENFEPEFVLE